MKRMNRFFLSLAVFGFLGVSSASAQYILNQTSQQNPADFNIGGTGTANIFNAASQYDINGVRALGATNLNLFVGYFAGSAFNTGTANSFIGANTGFNNTTGANNAFAGFNAGFNNTTASDGAFFGAYAGQNNLSGYSNSFFGSAAGYSNTHGDLNLFTGFQAGYDNTTGNYNSFVGAAAGINSTAGSHNTFVGYTSGSANTTGNHNTLLGSLANVGASGLSYATAIGAGAVVSTSNTILLGRTTGADKVVVYGLGLAGSTSLCRNGSFQISTCSSSLRYKTNIAPFLSGLSFIKRLRPIAYDWKDGGADVGFGAEDVARINPLFVSYNERGEVEGVKYDRLSVAFVNAFKEQQTQIDTQARQIAEQQKQIDALKALVCAQNRTARGCRE